MKLTQFLTTTNIILPLRGSNPQEVLEELIRVLPSRPTGTQRRHLLEQTARCAAMDRGAIARHLALPNVLLPEWPRTEVAFGIHLGGIDLRAVDTEPVHFVILVVGSERQPMSQLRTLARFNRLLGHDDLQTALLRCTTPGDVLQTLRRYEQGRIDR